jgi:hypothetical protein
MKTKICTKCKVERDITEFHKNKNNKDGLTSNCKICAINRSKEYREKNLEKVNERYKVYREKNLEKEKERYKEYREKNLEKEIERNKKYRYENHDKFKLSCKKSKQKNKEKNKEKNVHIIAWRTLLNNSIKRFNTTKENKTIELLTYSAQDLKEHLESKFLDGMSWSNRSEWHIDHIKPVSSFDKNEKMSVVNSLDNLQPLWAKDNLSKGSKII